jgi:hypothetical protein
VPVPLSSLKKYNLEAGAWADGDLGCHQASSLKCLSVVPVIPSCRGWFAAGLGSPAATGAACLNPVLSTAHYKLTLRVRYEKQHRDYKRSNLTK